MLVSCGRVMVCVAVSGQGFRLAFFVGTVANHGFTRIFVCSHPVWMDFAVLCMLQAIHDLVGWYEESNSSDAIKALREEFGRSSI